MLRMAVIGYGARIKMVLQEIMRVDSSCKIVAIVDVRNEEIRQELKSQGIRADDISYYEGVDDMLAAGGIDGILIGTRCDLHTGLACRIVPSGIPLFLEKPVSTNIDDLIKLRNLSRNYPHLNENVVVSFPLRLSALTLTAKRIVDSGQIGTVEHVQAVNNVTYGGVYYQNWYRDASIHGGLFLAKTTHDYDYINYVLGTKPVRVAAVTSKRIFTGTKPAGLKCHDCDEQAACPESPHNLRLAEEKRHGDYCVFAVDTGNEDSGSSIVEYESGMHVSYSQNFFARKNAAARGARFLGYKGTVEFDWYTDELKVYMHHTPKVETHRFDSQQGHFGGDTQLAINFIDLMRGTDRSKSPLNAGITSALMCLKSIESAKTRTFQDIEWPDETNLDCTEGNLNI